MICVRLEGGLGNQLFQYAAGRALALKFETELLLDLSTLNKLNHRVTQRKFELEHLNHVGRILTEHESSLLSWLRYAKSFSSLISPWLAYVERDVGYNAAFKALPDQSYLIGYWQSYYYFADISKQLMIEFMPRNALSPMSLSIADSIDSTTSVALHVRRGDYVTLASATKFHGVLPSSYYEKALAQLYMCINAPKVFVFSDDPEWCRANLKLGNGATFVTHNVGANSWEDLVLMSRCRHHVIANSSFSWWGAWLADQHWADPLRVVIAPANWFSICGAQWLSRRRHLKQNLGDRFPPHWNIIS